MTRYGLDGWDTATPPPTGNENFVAWADLNGSDALTNRRVFGITSGAPISTQTASGTVTWSSTDWEGSVRMTLSNSGSVLTSATYDAYGKLTSGTQADRYGYAGGQLDSLTGLIAQGNGTREYDPSLGKWYQQDPLGFAGGDTNLYRYVGNTPTTATDPIGLTEAPVTTGSGAAGTAVIGGEGTGGSGTVVIGGGSGTTVFGGGGPGTGSRGNLLTINDLIGNGQLNSSGQIGQTLAVTTDYSFRASAF